MAKVENFTPSLIRSIPFPPTPNVIYEFLDLENPRPLGPDHTILGSKQCSPSSPFLPHPAKLLPE